MPQSSSSSAEAPEAQAFVRMAPDHRDLKGPFDVIGDVHGCADELLKLLDLMGYQISQTGDATWPVSVVPPQGRRAVFVGDLVDRGPKSMLVIKIVRRMIADGHALTVVGNHDEKFLRWLKGNDVTVSHGLEQTIRDFEGEPDGARDDLIVFLSEIPIHLWLDGGKVAVAHAGILAPMLGKSEKHVRRFCLYGDTEGKRDKQGLPIRYHWAAAYEGKTTIFYGHTPVPNADWVNNTLCLDTGCCFGGALTAVRWPEREIVSVPAFKVYSERPRPFGHPPERPAS